MSAMSHRAARNTSRRRQRKQPPKGKRAFSSDVLPSARMLRNSTSWWNAKTLFAINGPGLRGRKMARGVGVEAASVWRRVTGSDSARGTACRIGALRQRGRGQRDARRRNSGNQCEFGPVDHGLSPEFGTRQRHGAMLFGDQEVGSMRVILN